MPSIGETLREARMRQRLDIADVELRTKIRAKYLRALENEEFGLLPGPTFVKTFLRTYAEVLGLDPHRLVEEYRARHETRDEAEIQPMGAPASARRERRRPPGRGPGPVALLAGAVVAVLAFFAILGVLGGEDEDPGERQAARTQTEQRRTPKPKPRPRRRPAPRAVALRIAPTVPTYVCVDRGPGTEVVFEGVLQEAQTFRGKKVRVNLGKTSVDMRANGKRVPLEPGPNPAGWEFSPRGSKALPVGQRPCA